MVGRTSKTREATQTVGLHGQHQAVDTNNRNITVCTGCQRPQSLEGNRQSVMLANNQTMFDRSCHDLSKRRRHDTHLLSPTTSLFGSVFLSHDKHGPCGAVQPTTNSRCRKKYVLLGALSVGGPRARAPSAPWLIRHWS